MITYWNAAAERLYGYRAAQVLGRFVSFLASKDRQDEIAELLRKLARGEEIETFETIRVARDGRLLDVDVTLWPVRDRHGTITGSSGFVRDIADRRRAEAALAELQDLLWHSVGPGRLLEPVHIGRLPFLEDAHIPRRSPPTAYGRQ